jgi:hypothetical protein
MVVAGLYDGSVAVYNLQSKNSRPSHISDAQNGMFIFLETKSY